MDPWEYTSTLAGGKPTPPSRKKTPTTTAPASSPPRQPLTTLLLPKNTINQQLYNLFAQNSQSWPEAKPPRPDFMMPGDYTSNLAGTGLMGQAPTYRFAGGKGGGGGGKDQRPDTSKAKVTAPESTSTVFPGDAPTGHPADQPIVDPLAVQAFFSSTIAPYLEARGNEMRGTANSYASTMNQLLSSSSMPAAYKGVLQASIPQHKAAYEAMASALQGAAVAGPQLDALVKTINEAKNAQVKRYYQEQQNAALGGGTGDLATILSSLGLGGQNG